MPQDAKGKKSMVLSPWIFVFLIELIPFGVVADGTIGQCVFCAVECDFLTTLFAFVFPCSWFFSFCWHSIEF
jgi:hypothetical protein